MYNESNKHERFKKGKSLLDNISNYTVIDLETTGRSIYQSEIVEMSAVRVRNNEIINTYTQLVKPSKMIPNEITKLTGITNEDVFNKPNISDVLSDYINFLGDDILLGHNINSFDINILYDLCFDVLGTFLDNNFIDTLYYARHCNIDVNDYKLDTLCKFYGISDVQKHRSLDDCYANHFLYQKLMSDFTNEKLSKHITNKETVDKSNFIKPKNSAETIALNRLKSTLQYIIDKKLFDVKTLSYLKDCILEDDNFVHNYPFNKIYDLINEVLKDNIIDPNEIDTLTNLFYSVIDPLKLKKDVITNADFADKVVCLTGDFKNGPKDKIIEILKKSGLTISKNVTKKVNILLVGSLGSENWQCGNYGSKIKKALEYQEKGIDIRIINEDELLSQIKSKEVVYE